MPVTHSRTFRVRHYECDGFGHLNNANYLRYMQEAAFDASAALGYDIQRYQEMGCHWLIRETDIEYLQPVRYGENLEVTTWVMDFHRVRSRRAYELRRANSGEVVARAVTDWVFLDSRTGRPTSIPPEMATAFLPDGPAPGLPARQAFPKLPPAPAGAYSILRRVTWQDIDPAEHVNNAAYLNFVDDCGFQVIAAHGWPVSRLLSEGFAILIRRHHIQYIRQAILGDELTISTWFSDVKRSMATRHYDLRRSGNGEQIAVVHSLGVWVNLETGRPIRIPEQMLADFAPNWVEGD